LVSEVMRVLGVQFEVNAQGLGFVICGLGFGVVA
jgi:hypothetical protein